MAVPKRKQTPSRTGMRRAQTMKYSTKNIVEDKKSGELSPPIASTAILIRSVILDFKLFFWV